MKMLMKTEWKIKMQIQIEIKTKNTKQNVNDDRKTQMQMQIEIKVAEPPRIPYYFHYQCFGMFITFELIVSMCTYASVI